MKKIFVLLIDHLKKIYAFLKESIAYGLETFEGENKKEKQRVILVFIGTLVLVNYLLFCLHSEKNVFNIFPSFPVLDSKKEVTVYFSDLKALKMLKEKRMIPSFNSNELYAKYLFNLVVKGSHFENTSMLVPIKLFVRKVWIDTKSTNTCIFDVEPIILPDKFTFIKGSEKIFKNALQKTISENISGIQKIIILEKGIPHRGLWEL